MLGGSDGGGAGGEGGGLKPVPPSHTEPFSSLHLASFQFSPPLRISRQCSLPCLLSGNEQHLCAARDRHMMSANEKNRRGGPCWCLRSVGSGAPVGVCTIDSCSAAREHDAFGPRPHTLARNIAATKPHMAISNPL